MTTSQLDVRRLMDLTGRRAFVTGAAGHIGYAVAEVLAQLGAVVALVDKDRGGCESRAHALSDVFPGSAFALTCDLSSEKDARAAIREAAHRMKGLDILVHSAAHVGTTQDAGWAEPFARQTVEAWDRALRVNLTAAFVLAQEAQADLRRSGHGTVIFIGSIYGHVGPDLSLYAGTSMVNPAAYGASKGGLRQLVRYLASELAPEVRVNMVSPGGVLRGQAEAFVERYAARTLLRRMAREDDIKGAIAYLASDLSAYVTGHDLLVDGGWTAL